MKAVFAWSAFMVALFGCGGQRAITNANTTQETPSVTSPPPLDAGVSRPAPFVVALVVDQLSAWIAEERVPLLPRDGFFAKLAREGTWVRALRYPYAITDTAPGHAALHTGKVPAETRIVVNEIPDERTGARTSFFLDTRTRLVTPRGLQESPGSSAAALGVPTVADRLREARPNARVVSISLKDRASLLPAGKKPTHALWFDANEGSFVTSTAIEPTFPAWARAAGDAQAILTARAQVWSPLDETWLAEHATRDDAPGEGDLDGLGTTFPHRAPTSRAFRATPMSDERILALALAAARSARDQEEPFLLLLSMSASDVIGHAFGPSSWEAWDHLRRLDASLASFLGSLERIAGASGVRVLVAGDHGNSVMPEARTLSGPECVKGVAKRPDPYDRPLCVAGGRLEPNELRQELRDAVGKTPLLGDPTFIVGVADGYVFLSAAARGLPPAKRALLDRVVRQVFESKHRSDVAEILDARELEARCPSVLASSRGIPERAKPGEDTLTLVCRSWTPNAGAGDYFVVPSHGSFFDGEVVAKKGASHGTPYLYDRTVPLFVWSSVRGEVEAGRVVLEPVDFSAYAAIESSFAGLDARRVDETLDALRAR